MRLKGDAPSGEPAIGDNDDDDPRRPVRDEAASGNVSGIVGGAAAVGTTTSGKGGGREDGQGLGREPPGEEGERVSGGGRGG